MRIGLRVSLLLAALFFTTTPAAAARLTLAWTDTSNDESGFRIERRISGGDFAQIAVVAANVTSFADSSVTVGTTYCYRVQAYDPQRVSASSNEACGALENPSLPTVAIGASTSTATEGGAAGRFLVRRTGSTAAALAVSYTVGGTATAGSDYAALLRTVVIPAGASSAVITVRPTNDTRVESSETVVVRLNAGTAYTMGAPSSATVRILSDDKPTVTIAASTSTATEGAAAGRFLVRRTGSTAAALAVSYTVGGTATAGSDYAALLRTVVIPAGASSAVITVRPTNDTRVESSETVVVRLNAGTAYTMGAPSSATVRILSDDKPTVTIAASTSTATEGAAAGRFLVRRTGSTAAALAVSYTVGGTATAGSDYAALLRTVVIPAGASSAVITVRPTNDTRVESSETVVVRLNAGTAYTMGAPSSATVRILSDDVVPSITIDNGRTGTSFTGTWSVSAAPNPYGSASLFAAGSGQDTYRWTPTIPTMRAYDVYAWWTAYPNRSTNVQYRIVSAEGTTVTTRDQRTGGGQWQYLGTFQFNAGTGGYVQVSDTSGSIVSADAVLFAPR